MRILLLTNMPAYQQVELSRAFVELVGAQNFRLGVLSSLSDARKDMGWIDDYDDPFLLRYADSTADRAAIHEWIADADVVIQGRFPIKHLRARISSGKLTFAYQERIWKKGFSIFRLLSRIPFLIKHYWSVDRANYHLLAAGRYAATDLGKLGFFKNRNWKFGYFIATRAKSKKPSMETLNLVWCGRFIPLKRPERALILLRTLSDSGIKAQLTMIGGGELEDSLRQTVNDLQLNEKVNFTGRLGPDKVNDEMSRAHIMLMSSDHREGWGVVINEAINNACLPIVCDEVGSAQWLIEDGVTGLIYQDELFDAMCQRLIEIIAEGEQEIEIMASKGHERHSKVWSAEAAAERVISLSNQLLKQESRAAGNYAEGPCSPAYPAPEQ